MLLFKLDWCTIPGCSCRLSKQSRPLLHRFRRLRTRCERHADTYEALLWLACTLICWRLLIAAPAIAWSKNGSRICALPYRNVCHQRAEFAPADISSMQATRPAIDRTANINILNRLVHDSSISNARFVLTLSGTTLNIPHSNNNLF